MSYSKNAIMSVSTTSFHSRLAVFAVAGLDGAHGAVVRRLGLACAGVSTRASICLLGLAPRRPARQIVVPLAAVGRLQVRRSPADRSAAWRARARSTIHKRAVDLQILGDLVAPERAVVGVERLVELAARHEEGDDVGVGAAAIGRGVDGRLEVGERLVAVAELVPELGPLDARLRLAVVVEADAWRAESQSASAALRAVSAAAVSPSGSKASPMLRRSRARQRSPRRLSPLGSAMPRSNSAIASLASPFLRRICPICSSAVADGSMPTRALEVLHRLGRGGRRCSSRGRPRRARRPATGASARRGTASAPRRGTPRPS